MEKKAKKVDALKETRAQVRALGKELSKLRSAFAALLGSHERTLAREAELKDVREKVKRLYTDPVYSVPQETKRRVEELEKKVSSSLVRMTGKAAQEDVDDLAKRVKALERGADEQATATGDHHDRLVLLEDAATAPASPHASPPAHPSPNRAEPPEHDPDNDEDASSEEDDVSEQAMDNAVIPPPDDEDHGERAERSGEQPS